MTNVTLYEYNESGGRTDSATYTAVGSNISMDVNGTFAGTQYDPTLEGVDAFSGAIVTVGFEHHEIHEGDHYFVGSFQTLNAGGSVVFAITPPNTTKWTNMLFSVEGTNQTEVQVSYDASTTGGTLMSPTNNNLNSANVYSGSLVLNPTVSNVGSIIFTSSIGSAVTNPSAQPKSGIIGRENEIILKQNSTHLFKIISRGNGNIVSYIGEWYEHTSSN